MNDDGPESLLLVDDDDIFRERLGRALRERGFEVHQAADAEQALGIAREEGVDLAVVDLRMPGESGLDLLRALKELESATDVIVLTGYGSIATAVEAVRLGAFDYLTKPIDADDIVRAFETRVLGRSPPTQVPSLSRVEWEHINRVLLECDGNVTQAARLLGLHRRSLQRKLYKRPSAW